MHTQVVTMLLFVRRLGNEKGSNDSHNKAAEEEKVDGCMGWIVSLLTRMKGGLV